MLETSKKFADKIVSDSRKLLAKIEVNGEQITENIWSIKLVSNANNSDDISLGGSVSSYVELELQKSEVSFSNKEISIFIGMNIDNTIEYVQIGVFTPQRIEENNNKIKFTAYDRMYTLLSGAYFSELEYPVTSKEILKEIATKTGISINIDSLETIIINKRLQVTSTDENGIESFTYINPFDGYTYREAVGYIASLMGCFATFNNVGILEFRWYKAVDYEINASRYFDDLVTNELEYTVDFLKCIVNNDELKTGDGETGISIENVLMTQERLNIIYDNIRGFHYKPASLSFLGDMRLELGDIVKVSDKYNNKLTVPIMHLEQEFDGGLKTIVASYGKTSIEENTNQKGAIVEKIDRQYTELLLVKELLSNTATIDYIKSYSLTVEKADMKYATIENLEALKIKVDNLDVSDLKAINAEINNLKSNDIVAINANINEIKTKYITTDNANLVFATIKDLKSTNAEINNLKSNDIIAINANIENIKSNYLETAVANVTYATINSLNSAVANINFLTTNIADIKSLMFGSAAGNTITTDFSNSVISTISDATIKSAMIESLSANKLVTGIIDTNSVKIQSKSGKFLIYDNTIQISDSNKTRVQIGKDKNNDYNMYVWDANGNLMFSADGITDKAIKSNIIRDDMILDNANINAKKLDISTLFTEINKSTEIIKATKIYFDSQAQTLDFAFNTLTSTVNNNSNNINSQGTAISTIQGQINSKIWKQDINTSINDVNAKIIAMDTNYSNLEQNLNGFKADVVKTYTTKTDFNCLNVGGRNLLQIKKMGVYGPYNSITEYTENGIVVVKNADNSYIALSSPCFFSTDFQVGQYTVSGYATVDNQPIPSDFFGSNCASTYGNNCTQLYVDTKTGYFYITQNYVSGNNWLFHTHNKYKKGTILKFIKLKLEKGNKATDWTPAVEDIQSQLDTNASNISSISTKQATIEQTVDSINTIITSQQSNIDSISGNVANLESKTNLVKQTVDSNVARLTSTETNITNIKNNVNSINTSIININKKQSNFEQDLSSITSRVTNTETNIVSTNNKLINLTIGGRNLLLNSDVIVNNNAYNVAVYELCEPLKEKEKYTFSFCISPPSGLGYYGLYLSEGYQYIGKLSPSGTEKQILSVTIIANYYENRTPDINIGYARLRIYRFPNDGSITQPTKIYWAKIEKGDKATDWTPAVEDVSNDISVIETRITTAEQKITDNSIVSTVRNSTLYTKDLQDIKEQLTSNILDVSTVATQTANKFNWLVQSGSSSSNFTITDRLATLLYFRRSSWWIYFFYSRRFYTNFKDFNFIYDN